MRFRKGAKLDFDQVLIEPGHLSEIESRSRVNLECSHRTKWSMQSIIGIPIIAANMYHTGTMKMAQVLESEGLFTALHKSLNQSELHSKSSNWSAVNRRSKVFWSVGMDDPSLNGFRWLNSITDSKHPPMICLDVANGHLKKFCDLIKILRREYPLSTIMAGNVVTAAAALAAFNAGADIIKVGIGPGSVCTTRKMTGVGYPQLSAIIECSKELKSIGGLICADGGCRTPGDIAKAFAAGADFVMLGGMLAGHDECAGNVIPRGDPSIRLRSDYQRSQGGRFRFRDCSVELDAAFSLAEIEDGKVNLSNLHPEDVNKYFERIPAPAVMEFYGMASSIAMERHNGGRNTYRAPEGKLIEVPHRGSVINTVREILGGLRSTCSYVGTDQLNDLSTKTVFVVLADSASSRNY